MIVVKDYIEGSPVVSKSVIEFSIFKRSEYITLFNKYKKKGVITNDTQFEDNKWVIFNGVDVSSVSFTSSEMLFEKMFSKHRPAITFSEFIVAVKSFYLYQLSSYTTNTLRHVIPILNRFMIESTFTSIDKLTNKIKSSVAIMSHAPIIIEFFSYLESFYFNEELLEELGAAYLDYITERRESGLQKRALPTFDTMFRFNDIMNEFTTTSIDDEREKFFPLILWWKISTIIPIRSTEFTLIPKDCLVEKKGLWYIKLNRSKIKGSKNTIHAHDFDSTFELSLHQISDEIASLIKEYLTIVDKYDSIENYFKESTKDTSERAYLLSSRSYYKFNKNKIAYRAYKYKLDYFSSALVNKLIKRFLIEVVFGHYGIDITPKSKEHEDITESLYNNSMNIISLMDTRHFAIMNMVYMGYEPNTIQRIVGHKSIQTSFSYYSHVEIFTNCYTVSIAKRMAFTKNSEFKNSILDIDYNDYFAEEGDANIRYKIIKEKQAGKTKGLKKLDKGFCTYDKTDFLPCKLARGNHMRCKFFIPNENNYSKIEDEICFISNEISAEIKTLKYLARQSTKIKNFSEEYKASLNKIHSKVLSKAELISSYYFS